VSNFTREILKARAHFYLSENAEYHAAKERQSFCKRSTRTAHGALTRPFHGGYVDHPHDRAGLGYTVLVLDSPKAKKFATSGSSDDVDVPRVLFQPALRLAGGYSQKVA